MRNLWTERTRIALDQGGADVSVRRVRRKALRPLCEPIESRVLLNGAAAHLGAVHARQSAAHVEALPSSASTNPFDHYRIFIGQITSGPDKGVVLEGPIVLGIAGRIQVSGVFLPKRGPAVSVVGTVAEGAVSLRLVTAGGGAFEASGSGVLQNVRGGFPNGENLIGSGNLSGPFGNDSGTWATLPRARVPGFSSS